jgi:hypothetical protein
VREAAREVLEAERDRLGRAAADPPQVASEPDLVARVRDRAEGLARPHPQP